MFNLTEGEDWPEGHRYIDPGLERYPVEESFNAASVACRLKYISNREFFDIQAGQVHAFPRNGLPFSEWSLIWRHEYNRRFLLRPAQFVPTPEQELLRSINA